jgi:hypothetical protein
MVLTARLWLLPRLRRPLGLHPRLLHALLLYTLCLLRPLLLHTLRLHPFLLLGALLIHPLLLLGPLSLHSLLLLSALLIHLLVTLTLDPLSLHPLLLRPLLLHLLVMLTLDPLSLHPLLLRPLLLHSLAALTFSSLGLHVLLLLFAATSLHAFLLRALHLLVTAGLHPFLVLRVITGDFRALPCRLLSPCRLLPCVTPCCWLHSCIAASHSAGMLLDHFWINSPHRRYGRAAMICLRE